MSDKEELDKLKKLLESTDKQLQAERDDKTKTADLTRTYPTVARVLGETPRSEKSGSSVLQFKQKSLEKPDMNMKNLDEIMSKLYRNEERVQRLKFELGLKDAQLQGVEDFSKDFAKAVVGRILFLSKKQGVIFHRIEEKNHTRDIIKNWGPVILVGLISFTVVEINNDPTLKAAIANFLSDRINVLGTSLISLVGFIAFLRYRGGNKKNKQVTNQ